MSEFDEQLKDHLLKYHLRDLAHDAAILREEERNNSLWDDIERLQEAMQEFVDRCERGEVRSKYTYAKFKKLLAGDEPVLGRQTP